MNVGIEHLFKHINALFHSARRQSPGKPTIPGVQKSLDSRYVHLIIIGEAKIAHGGRGARVVEPFGEDLEANYKPGALHEPESLPQCMRPVVPVVEVDHFRPYFYHGVYGLNGEWRLRLATRKRIVLVCRPDFLQIVLKGSMG